MMARLGDVTEIFSGTGFPKEYQGKTKGKYPFYKVGDISKNVELGYKRLAICDNYIDEDVLNRLKGNILPRDTVVFAKIGEAVKLNRRAITNGECLVDNNVMGIAPIKSLLNIDYLFYFMCTLKLERLSEATTVPSIRRSLIENIEISLPDLQNQIKIAEQISCIDYLINLCVTQLDSLNLIIKSRFIEMFGDSDFPTTELINLIQKGKGLSYGIVVPGDNVDTGVPMIRPSDFKNGSIDLSNLYKVSPDIEVKYKKTRLIGNELLVQVIGQPGQVMLATPECFNMNVTRNLAVICPEEKAINRIYLKEFIEQEESQRTLIKNTKQSTLKQLPLNLLKKLQIKVPPIDLQNQFADFVEQVDKSKLAVQQSLNELETLKKSLMQQYFG